jgi:hypothetical protein
VFNAAYYITLFDSIQSRTLNPYVRVWLMCCFACSSPSNLPCELFDQVFSRELNAVSTNSTHPEVYFMSRFISISCLEDIYLHGGIILLTSCVIKWHFSCIWKTRVDPCMFSFGYFPGVRLSFTDVSEPSVRSIFKGWMKNMNSERRAWYLYIPCQG